MAESPRCYDRVLGAQERILPDGRKVYEMVSVDPKDLPKYNPPGFPGWFIKRGEDRVAVRLWPGDKINLPLVEEPTVSVPSASPITRPA